jgi:hypothetical protein
VSEPGTQLSQYDRAPIWDVRTHLPRLRGQVAYDGTDDSLREFYRDLFDSEEFDRIYRDYLRWGVELFTVGEVTIPHE